MRHMDRLIDIERKERQQDASGDEIDVWFKLVSRRPAAYVPLRGDERFTAAQFVAKQQIEFQVRWAPDLADLNPRDRIIYPPDNRSGCPLPDPDDNRVYDIIDVAEVGRQEGFKVTATRRAESA